MLTVFGSTQSRQAKDKTLLGPSYSLEVIERTRLTIHHKTVAQLEAIVIAMMNDQAEDIVRAYVVLVTLQVFDFEGIYQMCRKTEALCNVGICGHTGPKDRLDTSVVVHLDTLTAKNT